MTPFLLVQTQSDWQGPTAGRFLDDAVVLAGYGHPVTVFLVQDAVTTAVRGATPLLARLAELGATVWVDDFSLAQRALRADQLDPAATVTDMATVVVRMLDGCTRVVWH